VSAPELVVIAAVAEGNRVIGREMELPWHLPEDLRRFKRLTLGHPLVMGRRTFESLVHQFGGPLPGRENAVLTSDPEAVRALADGAQVEPFGSLDAALEAYADRERAFLGGGASVYKAALDTSEGAPLADRLELTLVEGSFEGDTFFPPYEHLLGTWYRREGVEQHSAEGGRPAFRFETWVRV
jgi:dihydrofolate reductase